MHRLVPAFVLCSALLGQSYTIVSPKFPGDPDSMAGLVKSLKRQSQGAWILLSGANGSWLPELEGMFREEDMLIVAGLPVYSPGAASPLGSELRATHTWGPEARWVLVGQGARVLESGIALPTASQLSEALSRHGIRGKIGELETFVASNPGNLEAREILLGEHILLAMRRTTRVLKPAASPESDDPARPESERSLTTEEDERIWGRAVALLDRLFQSGDWQVGCMFGWAGIRYPNGRFSPSLRAASLRYLPWIEEHLRRYPGHGQAWTLWAQFADNAGGRPLRPLLDSISAVPGQRDPISSDIYAGYVRDARRRGDWMGIRDVLAPRWERLKDEEYEVLTFGEPSDPLKDTWDSILKPLVEAHLRLGANLDADRIVRDLMIWRPSKGLPSWASALAKQCGQPYLASQWAAMAVPKK